MTNSPTARLNQAQHKSSGSFSLRGHVTDGQSREEIDVQFTTLTRTGSMILGTFRDEFIFMLQIQANDNRPFVVGRYEVLPQPESISITFVAEKYGAVIELGSGYVRFSDVTANSIKGEYALQLNHFDLAFDISGTFDLID